MSDQINYYTEECLTKLKEELNYLITKERPNISRQIAEARDKGDLSENAEYDAAKDAQGLLEFRISKLQKDIANARVMNAQNVDSSKALILATVKIKEKKTGRILNYTLVNEKEADLKINKISISSPIGKGLLGKKVGEVVEIEVPAGKLTFEIIEISR